MPLDPASHAVLLFSRMSKFLFSCLPSLPWTLEFLFRASLPASLLLVLFSQIFLPMPPGPNSVLFCVSYKIKPCVVHVLSSLFPAVSFYFNFRIAACVVIPGHPLQLCVCWVYLPGMPSSRFFSAYLSAKCANVHKDYAPGYSAPDLGISLLVLPPHCID